MGWPVACPKCGWDDIDCWDPRDGDDPWILWGCLECGYEWEVAT